MVLPCDRCSIRSMHVLRSNRSISGLDFAGTVSAAGLLWPVATFLPFLADMTCWTSVDCPTRLIPFRGPTVHKFPPTLRLFAFGSVDTTSANMPLFKRTQKRMARKAMEDETGLTKIKAALREENGGVASEESSDEDDFESGSESEQGSEDEDEDEVGELSDEDSDSDDDEEIGENKFMANARREKRKREGLDSEDEDEDEDESDDEDGLPLTVDEALEQPLYPITTSRIITDAQGGQHETKGTVSCVYCPNRILKNDNMVQLHLRSTGHSRAQKRFEVKIGEMQKTQVDLETVDPRDVVADIEDELAARTSKVESLPQRKRTAAEKEADEDEGDAEAEGDKTLSVKAQRRLEKKMLRNEARAARRKSAGEGGAKPQVQAVKENKDKPAQPKDASSTRKAKKAKRAEAAAPAASELRPVVAVKETKTADAPSRKAKKANKAAE